MHYIVILLSDQGPYLIICGDGINPPMYLNIVLDEKSGNKYLGVHSKKEYAEEFMVKVFDGYHLKFEFSLATTLPVYKEKKPTRPIENPQEEKAKRPIKNQRVKSEKIKVLDGASHDPVDSSPIGQKSSHSSMLPLEWYLKTSVHCFGSGSEPTLCMTPKFRHTRMVLKSRIDPKTSVDTQQWLEGKDAYYISCISRFRDGFLGVKKIEDDDYRVCVMSSPHCHCDKTFMVFRLQSCSQ